jgi:hypothetical protein
VTWHGLTRHRTGAIDQLGRFSLYEAAGVVTNLLAGVAGARWGIKATLLVGLWLQIGGLCMLLGWDNQWDKSTAIVYVTLAQMLCGIAKDLVKLGGKTVAKLVTPDEKEGQLFHLVATITGWKNSLKGAGYFLGSLLVLWDSGPNGTYGAVLVLVGLILLAMPWAALRLSPQLGRDANKQNATLSQVGQRGSARTHTMNDFIVSLYADCAAGYIWKAHRTCDPWARSRSPKQGWRGMGGAVQWDSALRRAHAAAAVVAVASAVAVAVAVAQVFSLAPDASAEEREHHRNRNWLSLGRCFLFASRDCWFEVPLVGGRYRCDWD